MRLAAIVTGGLALAHVPSGSPRAESGDVEARRAVAVLAREVDRLEKRVELASSDDFYLLVDAASGTLKLMLRGAVLREYPIEGLEIGTPRIAFRDREVSGGWAARIWDKGALVPARDRERLEIVPPDSTAADSTIAPIIPPTPEEAYPVPHRYLVRYEGGLSLEVRPRELDHTVAMWERAARAFQVWCRDLRAVFRWNPEDAVRLRLVLRPEDAASLYRALPPDTRLLVITDAS